MFRRLRYVVHVKKCISEIGINLHMIHPEHRRNVQESGYQHRKTPQECATALLYKLARGHRPDGYDVVLSDWIDRGLVRRDVLDEIVHSGSAAAEPGGPGLTGKEARLYCWI